MPLKSQIQDDIGLIGLGVMGQNLARNMVNRGFWVRVFNRHSEKTATFLGAHPHKNLQGAATLKMLVKSLKRPRKLLVMVSAGPAVDEVLTGIMPLLARGDIIIDGGNSHYRDTIRRESACAAKGLHFVGMGVSGGEEGALHGPSLMPGASPAAWKACAPIFKKIAALDFGGNPCVTHVGENGAGHYIKMIHNGIEYGIMQIMAEAYGVLKNVYGLSAPQIGTIFAKYNCGPLKSFLFEIAASVLQQKDDLGKGYLIDKILDKAGQKGTGKWVAIEALERNAVLPTITLAVFARSASAQKEQRMALSRRYKKPKTDPKIPLAKFIKFLEEALYAGMISSYAQGLELISRGAKEQGWKMDLGEIVRIWEGGCIIRARLLNFLHRTFIRIKDETPHLFFITEVKNALQKNLLSWRKVVAFGVENAWPMPTLASSLSYFETMTCAQDPANFIQGLRDFFGAHTYQRTDREGTFHTQWAA